MYKYINHIYIYIYRGQGGECFPVPAPPTFADKILFPSLNIAPYSGPKWGGSLRGLVSAGNIVIFKDKMDHDVKKIRGKNHFELAKNFFYILMSFL